MKNCKSAPATELRDETAVTEETSTATRKLSVCKARNRRRKRWEMRRRKSAELDPGCESEEEDVEKKDAVKDLECVVVVEVERLTEIALSFPASTSSSDQSSENDTVVAEKPRSGYDNSDEVAEMMTTSHGFASIIGRRREMEDAVTVRTRFVDEDDDIKNGVNFDFFAVYDGHGGSDVAHFCQKQLHQVVAKEVREAMMFGGGVKCCKMLNWEKVMAGSFWKIDDQINSVETQESMKTIGSTAVVAVVGEEQLIVANCGDSRAVICRGGVAVPLSADHKPDRPDELERVEAVGGRVINWNGFPGPWSSGYFKIYR